MEKISREMYDEFSNATDENPIFAKFDINRQITGLPDCRFEGIIAAVTNTYQEGYIVHGAVLDGGTKLTKDDMFNEYQKYDWMNVPAKSLSAEILEPTDDLKAEYQKFMDMHKNAPFIVTGKICDDYPSYSEWDKDQLFPQYGVVEGTEEEWTVPVGTPLSDGTKVLTVEDIEKWMLENHPAYIQGFMARQDVPSGSFMVTPEPSGEYGVGMFEDYDARREYAQSRADVLGVTLGEEYAETIVFEAEAKQEDTEKDYETQDEMGDPEWDGIPEDDIPEDDGFEDQEVNADDKNTPQKDYDWGKELQPIEDKEQDDDFLPEF